MSPRIAALVGALALGGCTDTTLGWGAIYETSIAPHCAASACHSELSQAAGIDLHSEEVAFETLTGRPCEMDAEPAGGLVNPARPDQSYLVIVLRRDGSLGMPPNRRLGDLEIEDIEAWIARGARCD